MSEAEILDATPVVIGHYAAVERSQLEATVEISRKYPRSITKFKQESLSMVSLSPETAAEMGYALPRGGKSIVGPSTRLAEIMATAWGNLRYEARVTEVGDKTITATGYCFDCEKNLSAAVSVTRRITKKDGKRFDDDMIAVTGNAACSIALRNAIFKIIPRVYVDEVYKHSQKVAFGDTKSLVASRQTAFEVIAKLGVTPDRILAVIKRPGIEDVTLEDVILLRGLFQAVRDGESTVEEAFPLPAVEIQAGDTAQPAKEGTKSRVKDKLKANSAEVPPAELKRDPGPVLVAPSEAEIDAAYHGEFTDDQRNVYDLEMNKQRGEGLDPYDASVKAYLTARDAK